MSFCPPRGRVLENLRGFLAVAMLCAHWRTSFRDSKSGARLQIAVTKSGAYF